MRDLMLNQWRSNQDLEGLRILSKSQSSELEITRSNSRIKTLWKTEQLTGELPFSPKPWNSVVSQAFPLLEGCLQVSARSGASPPCPRAKDGLSNAGAQNHRQCPTGLKKTQHHSNTAFNPFRLLVYCFSIITWIKWNNSYFPQKLSILPTFSRL